MRTETIMEDIFHPIVSQYFASVVLPVAAPKPYTYYIPDALRNAIQVGVRVEVQFGRNKLYSGLVINLHENHPKDVKPKPILTVIDAEPIIHKQQIRFWQWIAKYYACTIGEVMNAALPANLKLASETRVVLSSLFDENYDGLNDKEYLIAEALSIQNELSIEDIRKILNQRTVYPLIHRLLEKRVLFLKEEIKTKYKPKKIACVRLCEPYQSDPNSLKIAFEKTARANRQTEALMAYIQLARNQEFVRKQDVYAKATVSSTVLKAMEQKEIFELYEREVSRLGTYEVDLIEAHQLTIQQTEAIQAIQTEFKDKKVVLLHGVTGSGKTRVYIEMIQKVLQKGGQVLYLLPEIALTTQIINRLQTVFGDEIAVYHSRLNNNERVELWKAALAGKPILLGARSSLFLPYQNLQLIVIDEEHDPSYKQTDPAPRYNARDAAIYLAQLTGAKVLLGTATPSIETYYNTQAKKYGLVEMKERFGGVELPEIVVVDKKEAAQKQELLQDYFSTALIDELKKALEAGEQAILFQNRRGYAPTLRCETCGWHSECQNCDVSMTYHKFHQNLQCHYCGSHRRVPTDCPACGSKSLTLKGLGTEKIEEALQIILPDARIGRMDFDTVRTKHAHARIINDFEERRLDILVGTQMVTKGLDFDNVRLVGVLSADKLWYYPDFRASERAYQLLTQVSGRAGRKQKRGKVLIQTYDTTHPVLKEVIHANYAHFFQREIVERRQFAYPPYTRLIKITLKHKKPASLNKATQVFSDFLKHHLGKRVIGPAVPSIGRVRSYYLMDLLIKMERKADVIAKIKRILAQATHLTIKTENCSQTRISIDVDPS